MKIGSKKVCRHCGICWRAARNRNHRPSGRYPRLSELDPDGGACGKASVASLGFMSATSTMSAGRAAVAEAKALREGEMILLGNSVI